MNSKDCKLWILSRFSHVFTNNDWNVHLTSIDLIYTGIWNVHTNFLLFFSFLFCKSFTISSQKVNCLMKTALWHQIQTRNTQKKCREKRPCERCEIKINWRCHMQTFKRSLIIFAYPSDSHLSSLFANVYHFSFTWLNWLRNLFRCCVRKFFAFVFVCAPASKVKARTEQEKKVISILSCANLASVSESASQPSASRSIAYYLCSRKCTCIFHWHRCHIIRYKYLRLVLRCRNKKKKK